MSSLSSSSSSSSSLAHCHVCAVTAQPTRLPSSQPSVQPSEQPTSRPSRQPSSQPTMQPSQQPSAQPSMQPSIQPSIQPTSEPTNPTGQPSQQPTRQPSGQPSRQPSSSPCKYHPCCRIMNSIILLSTIMMTMISDAQKIGYPLKIRYSLMFLHMYSTSWLTRLIIMTAMVILYVTSSLPNLDIISNESYWPAKISTAKDHFISQQRT